MKYQLIIQFLKEKYGDLDWIADMEDKLGSHLVDAEVDGHDIGSGEVNIFIHTNVPLDTFKSIEQILKENFVFDDVKIAYRNINSDNYICLWPRNLIYFRVI